MGQAQSEASRLKRDLIPTALHQDPPVYKLGLKDQLAIAEYKRQKERRKQEMEQRRRLVVKEVCGAVQAQLLVGVLQLGQHACYSLKVLK